jgi:ubiquinone/menaquinone biosynthesis C-methylase UbiE
MLFQSFSFMQQRASDELPYFCRANHSLNSLIKRTNILVETAVIVTVDRKTLMNKMLSLLFAVALLAGACGKEQKNSAAETPTPGRVVSGVKPAGPKNVEAALEALADDKESKDRAIWQKPNMVISMLGDLQGKTVADIGAGTGYFAFRLLPKAEKVVAIDIDERFVAFMDSMKLRLPEQYRDRFEPRLTPPDNPLLQPGEADAVIIVNTYGYIGNRTAYLRQVLRGMSAGGQLLIIDFKKNKQPVGPPDQFKVASSQVERELISVGFTIEKTDRETLDYQYIILATKPGVTDK